MRTAALIVLMVVGVASTNALAAKDSRAGSLDAPSHSSHALTKFELADANNPQQLLLTNANARGNLLSAKASFSDSPGSLQTDTSIFTADRVASDSAESQHPHDSATVSVRDLLLMLLVLVGLIAFQLRRAHDSLQRPFTNN